MSWIMTIWNGKNTLLREEKGCTLQEFIEMGRLEPGQVLHLVDHVKGHTNPETLFVGNCTPFHQPIENDCGIGWTDPNLLAKSIIEIYQPMFPHCSGIVRG